MDGREAVLAGYRGSLHISAAAIETVRNVRGVRTVSTQILELGAGQAEAVEKSIADLLKLKKIEFEKASAGLTPTGRQTLDEVAALLAKWPGVPIEISGHTDSLGAAEVNLDLSNRRAAAVKQYLVAKNIELSRLTSVGYGPTRPIATNETDAGRQANRRIEFHVKEAK
jgi:OOP family OmpA-OmpF porin